MSGRTRNRLTLIPPGARRGNPFFIVRGSWNGRPVERSTGTADPKVAARFLAGLPAALDGPAPANRADPTFGEAIDLYTAWRGPRLSRSDERYLARLRDYLGYRRLAAIGTAELVEAAAALYPAATPETRNRQAIVPAAAVLHYAAEQTPPWCGYVRIRRFREKRPAPRLPTAGADRLLLANSEGDLHMLLTVLFRQGLRLGDALRLTWGQLDLDQGWLHLQVRKTDQYLPLPLHPDLQALLAALERQRRAAGLPVDADQRLLPWRSPWPVYRRLRPLCRKLGLAFTPHMARHLFATRARAAGWDLADIKDAGGWRDLKSVERYGRPAPARLRALIGGKKG